MPSQFFVYPIFKNGSSSLNEYADEIKCRRLRGENIGVIDTKVHVYLRDPRERFISGVNTFVQHNADLDLRTMMTFIERYLFVNRHFAPQFFWLINLARFLPHHIPIVLHDIKDLKDVTPLHSDAKIKPPTEEFLEEFYRQSWNSMELYYYLDQQLCEQVGTQILFPEFMYQLRNDNAFLFDTVFGKSIQLVEMVRALP